MGCRSPFLPLNLRWVHFSGGTAHLSPRPQTDLAGPGCRWVGAGQVGGWVQCTVWCIPRWVPGAGGSTPHLPSPHTHTHHLHLPHTRLLFRWVGASLGGNIPFPAPLSLTYSTSHGWVASCLLHCTSLSCRNRFNLGTWVGIHFISNFVPVPLFCFCLFHFWAGVPCRCIAGTCLPTGLGALNRLQAGARCWVGGLGWNMGASQHGCQVEQVPF
jgi:hypothetical protein